VIDILFTIPRFIWVTLSKAFDAHPGCGCFLLFFYLYAIGGAAFVVQEQAKNLIVKFESESVLVGGGFFSPGTVNMSLSESLTLDPFYIDRFEVSEKQFQKFLDETNQISPATADFSDLDNNQPVTNVTIYEARAYCAHQEKRLPTEFEWEWAARDMRGSSYGSLFGNDWDAPSLPVDSRLLRHEGVLGLYGMVSSVGEWTEFHFGSTGEKDDQGNYVFPVRGGTIDGSWRGYSTSDQIPDAFIRKLFRADGRDPYVGFRCAKNID
jgi:formylglycine-generating enzyme required for sulfatase activity